MDYIIHMYDSNQYESYELALPDGATYSTSNYITLDTEDDILTITDVLHTAMGCIGYALDSVRLGILKRDVFVPLQDVHDVLISGHTSVVIHAVDFVHRSLIAQPVTLTHNELVELSYRMSKSSSSVYDGDEKSVLTISQEMDLWRKLVKARGDKGHD